MIDCDAEVWRPIPGFGGHYEASSLGRIRSRDRVVSKVAFGKPALQHYKGRVLRSTPDGKWGHRCVSVGVDGARIKIGVHRMVLLAFVGDPPPGHEGCHNDGDASNNRPSNLRWDTHENNNRDRLKHGTYWRGRDHHGAKASEDVIARVKRGEITPKEAARETGLPYKLYWRAKSGKTWRHVQG